MDEIHLRSEESFIDSEIRSTCGLSDRLLIGLYGYLFVNRQEIAISTGCLKTELELRHIFILGQVTSNRIYQCKLIQLGEKIDYYPYIVPKNDNMVVLIRIHSISTDAIC